MRAARQRRCAVYASAVTLRYAATLVPDLCRPAYATPLATAMFRRRCRYTRFSRFSPHYCLRHHAFLLRHLRYIRLIDYVILRHVDILRHTSPAICH